MSTLPNVDRHLPPHYAVARTRAEAANSPAAWLVGLLLVVYPVGAMFPPVYRNLGPGDILLGAIYVFGILRFYRQYAAFMSSGYGLFSVLALAGLATSIVALNQSVRSLEAVAQFATILWLLLPLVAIGISEMKSPLRYLEIGCWIYFAILVAGAVLLFGRGSDILLRNSGSNRHFMAIQLVSFEACLVPLAVVGVFTAQKLLAWKTARFPLLLGAALFAAILADSRTGVLVIGFVIFLGLAINRQPLVALAIVLFMVTSYFLVRESIWLNDLVGFERRGLLDDQVRRDLILSTFKAFGTETRQLWFGTGWQGSGFNNFGSGVIVHNTFLQVAAEWGVIGAACWMGIWLLPWHWLLRARGGDQIQWQVAILTMAGVHMGWMFHPIATTRNHWLGFAVGMGLAYRTLLESRGKRRVHRMPRIPAEGSIGQAVRHRARVQ